MGGYDVQQMAVYNNAALASRFFPEAPIGQIVPGAAADLIFVDYHPFTPLTDGNLPWHIIFGFQQSMVTSTMVAGKFVMKDRELLTLDEAEIAARKGDRAAHLEEVRRGSCETLTTQSQRRQYERRASIVIDRSVGRNGKRRQGTCLSLGARGVSRLYRLAGRREGESRGERGQGNAWGWSLCQRDGQPRGGEGSEYRCFDRAIFRASQHAGNRRDELKGKILVDVTVPLVPPKVATVQMPAAGSAAQEAKEIVGEGVEVCAAFQNISHEHLLDNSDVECDVLVTGTSKDARAEVIKLVEAAGLSGWDAGPIQNSVVVEGLTSVLIGINKKYGSTHAGIKITGVSK
jgi:hypothetical protein